MTAPTLPAPTLTAPTLTARGPRVAVVGGCQSDGIAAWLRRLVPGAELRAWHVHSSAAATPDAIAPEIAGFDLVVTQFSDDMDGGALNLGALRARHAHVVFMPVLVFAGFHPDLTFCGLHDAPFAFVRGPMEIQQSAIALAAFRLGIPASRVPRLFNAVVFRALGYLDAFAQARAAFLSVYARHGYDLAAEFDGWMERGCFMYSDNHPHIRVLGSLARAILAQAGLKAAPLATGDGPPDMLAASIQWPLYPALARPIGLAGSTDFVRSAAHTPPGEPRALPLPAFVDASYAVFEAAGRDRLADVPSVQRAMAVLRELVTA